MADASTLPHALLDDPGFTPSSAHCSALFDLLRDAERDDAPKLERVLARGGARVVDAVIERLPVANPTERARLVNVLGRLADERAADALRSALADGDERVARRAATALGKLDASDESSGALEQAWPGANAAFRRSLAEALGKVGSPATRALLVEEEHSEDPELARIAKKALLLFDRRHSRGGTSRVRSAAPLGQTLTVLARCRAGISALLADEMAPLGAARSVSPSLVELSFAGSVDELFIARTALDFGVRIELGREPDLAEAVARALVSQEAQGALAAWTEGSARYRLSFAEGGHQRALVVRIARAVTACLPELVNDPRAASWEIVVVGDAPRPHLVLVPIGYDDLRFAYRKRDVRAASHPTLAAALARVARPLPSDVVWDPFMGSGLELCEVARLGPARRLLGSDIDPAALDAARENLDAARVQVDLREGDALRLHPDGVSLIVTNPPMGRRLVRDGSVGDLLDQFVAHAARVLVPGGRLVWLSPLPERTRRSARRAGLDTRGAGPMVDMGGFEAELQVLGR